MVLPVEYSLKYKIKEFRIHSIWQKSALTVIKVRHFPKQFQILQEGISVESQVTVCQRGEGPQVDRF